LFLKNFVLPRRSNSSSAPAPLHAETIRSTIQHALNSAGLNAQGDIAATIDRALSKAGLNPPASSAPSERVHATVVPSFNGLSIPAIAHVGNAGTGEFLCRSFTCRAGTRAYKLYVPSTYDLQSDARVPLVVMLHGCTQSADDFAAGTRMNALAEQQGFLVAYPEQAANANGSRCWNWFRPADQQRGNGEPALIAGITREIASAWRVDEGQIYIAGLSAGAAMAIILATTYPELYAAVGAHSGLPYASAHDVPSAFAAMKSGGAFDSSARDTTSRQASPMPTIVFHGDADKTVAAANGKAIVDQAIRNMSEQAHLSTTTEKATAGRAYSRTVYAASSGKPLAEHWQIRDGGHAWSGGSADGSYADIRGPDASAEMIRFFKTHAR
jgi:poly(hydroxyalkanoate) depolymerase family esterase